MVYAVNGDIVGLEQAGAACRECNLFQLCLPVGMGSDELEELDSIIKRRRPLKRGEHLFHVGTPFHAIYAVRSGSIRTYAPTEDGHEQVTGFRLPGELLGLEAIHLKQHPCAAMAMETTSLCEIPFERLEELCLRLPGLQHQLLTVMSKELLQDQSLLMLLGKKSAEERLAALLLSLSERYQRRGFSPTDFHLSMSRNDIGNYLGMAVETVSRVFSRFQEDALLIVQRKHICILNLPQLAVIASRRVSDTE
ncbi:MAG: fumarate/nitrate reduction transcriptional regulator Fnr [Gammaproteobacteria bacterium]|nr:fumarate/nitrate reduction transcriptional regulator Fnr [Gammaproteobacteria bacterium]